MDFEQARFNMVRQQVQSWEVTNTQLLDAMLKLPRERFVPEAQQSISYTDHTLSFADGSFLNPAKLTARLIQALNLTKQSTVLEIGTGRGYATALLSLMAKKVTTLDIEAPRLQQSLGLLKELGLNNVSGKVVARAHEGYLEDAPYDAILINGSLELLPHNLRLQLNNQGLIVAIVGQTPSQKAVQVTRVNQHSWQKNYLFETQVPPLPGSHPEPQFVF